MQQPVDMFMAVETHLANDALFSALSEIKCEKGWRPHRSPPHSAPLGGTITAPQGEHRPLPISGSHRLSGRRQSPLLQASGCYVQLQGADVFVLHYTTEHTSSKLC